MVASSMSSRSSSEGEAAAPLLGHGDRGDAEHGRHEAKSRSRRWWTARWPLILAVGAVCFLAGLALHPTARQSLAGKLNLTYDKNPHLDVAVRVRVLNGLLQERYPDATGERVSRQENWARLDRLASCLETNTCTAAEQKVLLLSSYHFGRSEAGANGGEEVWARSLISALHSLNYTILYTWGSMDTLFIYQSIPEMVTAVLWEEGEYLRCAQRNESNYLAFDDEEKQASPWQTGKHACMQSEEFPHGIPHWKSFQFFFWADNFGPLGGKWMLSPEDYDSFRDNPHNHTYLGYSIEKRCDMYPTFTDREHRALILAKHARYFEKQNNNFHGVLGAAADGVRPVRNAKGEEVPFGLVTTAGRAGDVVYLNGTGEGDGKVGRGEPSASPEAESKATAEAEAAADAKADAESKPDAKSNPDAGNPPSNALLSLGHQPQREWTEILARSKALLGLGWPVLSPSPYFALCMGVPFINPVHQWDKKDPDNRRKWTTQQNALRFVEEPYVYHVREGDEEGLRDALQRAADTPIPRYIPPHMRFEAVVERIRNFVETDWQAAARARIAEHYGNASEWHYLAMDDPAEPLRLHGKASKGM